MNDQPTDEPVPNTMKCPQCGATLPVGVLQGLCPACLLKQGVEPATGPEEFAFQPPTVAEVADLFPQLEIIALIGKGGMGAVYKARQRALDRIIALKVLPPQAAASPGFADRFNREARALAKLSHPNIVALYEFGQAGPFSFFIMEFVDGLNLRQLQRSGQLNPRAALQIVPQICEALQFAHDEGVVHRDIKPENILLDKKGRVKIADFGIAKILGVTESSGASTETKHAVGTPHYMAPEQLEKPHSVDHRADIFSLGVVFYEMLTGELPLGRFAPPSRKVHVDVRLDEVVLHALEKEPERRYQQASSVKADVETITQSESLERAARSKPKSQFERYATAALTPLRYATTALIIVLSIFCLRFAITLPVPAGPLLFGCGLIGIVLGILKLLKTAGKWPPIIVVHHDLPKGSGGSDALAAPLAPGSSPPGGITAREKRRAEMPATYSRAILFGVVVFCLTFTAFAAVTFLLPKTYKATAHVAFFDAASTNHDTLASYDPYLIQRECGRVQSDEVIQKAVQQLRMGGPWQPTPVSNTGLLVMLRNGLDIRQMPHSSTIALSFYSHSPIEAAQIANAIAEAYLAVQSAQAWAHRIRGAIVDRALPQTRPIRPNIFLNLVVGACFGLVLGMLAGLLGLLFQFLSTRAGLSANPRSSQLAAATIVALVLLPASLLIFVHGAMTAPPDLPPPTPPGVPQLQQLGAPDSNPGRTDSPARSTNLIGQLKLKQAEERLNEIQQQSNIGRADPEQLEQARISRDIAQAELDGNSTEILRLKVQSAEAHLKTVQSMANVGRAAGGDVEKAKIARDIATAELNHDPLEAARLKLTSADLDLQIATRRREAGRVTEAEFQEAKSAREIAAAEYAQLLQAGRK